MLDVHLRLTLLLGPVPLSRRVGGEKLDLPTKRGILYQPRFAFLLSALGGSGRMQGLSCDLHDQLAVGLSPVHLCFSFNLSDAYTLHECSQGLVMGGSMLRFVVEAARLSRC